MNIRYEKDKKFMQLMTYFLKYLQKEIFIFQMIILKCSRKHDAK